MGLGVRADGVELVGEVGVGALRYARLHVQQLLQHPLHAPRSVSFTCFAVTAYG